MNQSAQTIRSDFDKIASLCKDGPEHNNTYYKFLFRHVPSHCERALEIGCGAGAFSRLLAARSDRVIAVDLSPNMIRAAKERSAMYPNISFQIGDAMEMEFPCDHFDCIVSIATLHHMPMEQMLAKMKSALKIGGALIIHDLFRSEGLFDASVSALALPVNILLRLKRTGRLIERRELREAWAEHARHDHYFTMDQARSLCADALPGAIVRRHLLWRYSMIWIKTSSHL